MPRHAGGVHSLRERSFRFYEEAAEKTKGHQQFLTYQGALSESEKVLRSRHDMPQHQQSPSPSGFELEVEVRFRT